MSTPTAGFLTERHLATSSRIRDPARAVVGPHNGPKMIGRVGIVVGEWPRIPVGTEQDPVLNLGD